jgi:hypothetical protein
MDSQQTSWITLMDNIWVKNRGSLGIQPTVKAAV